MNLATAEELRRVLERAGLRDPSLTDADREELFTLALHNTHDDAIDWLAARLEQERINRGRGTITFGDVER